MKYQSTRSDNININEYEAIYKGLSEDGGLFVCPDFKDIHVNVNDLLDKDFCEVALAVMEPWLNEFPRDILKGCIDSAYANTFDCKEVAPIKKLEDNLYVCELFRGRTSAFKDVALSLLPYLMKEASLACGVKEKICILTATSGDTGKAALEGFRDVDGTSIIVFYPKGGVSEIQEKQMCTSLGNNVRVCGIEGNFDDAQSAVKRVFNDVSMREFAKDKGYHFSSANSINIGRLLPQITYYYTSYIHLCKSGMKVGTLVDFAVPSGNFGNILAGYLAKSMGLPIGKLICASNSNNVLFDFLSTGEYMRNRDLHKTISPSMDILLSSNLERLLYYASDCNSEYVASLMQDLDKDGKYKISKELHETLLEIFYPSFASDKETKEHIQKCWEEYHYLMDSHTAVGYKAILDYQKDEGNNRPCVLLSTASPYKFALDVADALGISGENVQSVSLELEKLSGQNVPKGLSEVHELLVRHTDVCSKSTIDEFIKGALEVWK